jgi:hypothetical protein
MITTGLLLTAKLDTTKNETLKTVYDLVGLYNGGNLPNNIEKINVLERILVGAGDWLTSHRPKATGKNVARWNALDDLASQVALEGSKLGAKFLSGPTNWKNIEPVAMKNKSYWLEYLAPQHGAGYVLSGSFKTWRDGPGPDDQSFWEYLNINPPYAATMVKYYGNTPKAEKRRLVFKAGKLHKVSDDSLFDTQALSTHFSGFGWAIFVVSPDGKLYAHKHKVGIFHHSTFLSGSAVMAAGELVVEQGVIKCITAKSGHYLPSADNMRAFVRHFPEIPGQAVIIPNFAGNPLPAFRVSEFRFGGNAPKGLKRAQVQATLPVWSQAGVTAMLNKITA